MGRRPRTFGRFSLLLAVVVAGGCSYTKSTATTRTPFVPPVAKPEPVALLPDAPALALGLPTVALAAPLREAFQPPEARREAEATMQRAYLHFQRGRGLYQANDVVNARKEFDAAMDLINGKKVPAVIDIEYQIVTKANLHDPKVQALKN